MLARVKIRDFDDCSRSPQARRPQAETAETAILLFTKHDAQEYSIISTSVGALKTDSCEFPGQLVIIQRRHGNPQFARLEKKHDA